MPVEQMNISISPEMARFIRNKVKTGGFTNASEVVRAAVRRMQEDEAREARLARSAADALFAELTGADRTTGRDRARAGFVAIARGEHTDYIGRQGLADLAAGVKARGRKLLADRSRRA